MAGAADCPLQGLRGRVSRDEEEEGVGTGGCTAIPRPGTKEAGGTGGRRPRWKGHGER